MDWLLDSEIQLQPRILWNWGGLSLLVDPLSTLLFAVGWNSMAFASKSFWLADNVPLRSITVTLLNRHCLSNSVVRLERASSICKTFDGLPHETR